MREIKFRGLRADGDMAYGYLVQDEPNSTVYYNEYSQRIGWFPDSGGVANVPVKNGTVGQFTGLKDKNGKEIYEGDVLKAGGDVFEGEVIFDQSGGVWSCYVHRNKRKVELMTLVRFMHQRARAVSSTPEVIGNIYQNPELLNEE